MIQPPSKILFSPARVALGVGEALLNLVLSVTVPVSLVVLALLAF